MSDQFNPAQLDAVVRDRAVEQQGILTYLNRELGLAVRKHLAKFQLLLGFFRAGGPHQFVSWQDGVLVWGSPGALGVAPEFVVQYTGNPPAMPAVTETAVWTGLQTTVPFSVGDTVSVSGYGQLTVSAKTSSSLTLTNTGAAGNANVGFIGGAYGVVSSDLELLETPSKYSVTSISYTSQFPAVSSTLTLVNTAALNAGAMVYLAQAGELVVDSVSSGTVAVTHSSGAPENELSAPQTLAAPYTVFRSTSLLAQAGRAYVVYHAANTMPFALPASPAIGDTVTFFCQSGGTTSFFNGLRALVVSGNGNTIEDKATSRRIAGGNWLQRSFVWLGSTWVVS